MSLDLAELVNIRQHLPINFHKCNYGPRGPRILCAIFTHPKYYRTRLVPVANTWAKRCDLALFITSDHRNVTFESKTYLDDEDDVNDFIARLNLVDLNMTDDIYDKLTDKVIRAILHVNENYADKFDWFLKADDDSYMVMDNLRKFLDDKCPNEMQTYGKVLTSHREHGYQAGGSGYCMSREAVRQFSSTMRRNASFCRLKTKFEDVDIGECLARLNIYPGDSRDEFGEFLIKFLFQVNEKYSICAIFNNNKLRSREISSDANRNKLDRGEDVARRQIVSSCSQGK